MADSWCGSLRTKGKSNGGKPAEEASVVGSVASRRETQVAGRRWGVLLKGMMGKGDPIVLPEGEGGKPAPRYSGVLWGS